MLVMLKRTWPGNFRRVLRDEAGKALLDDEGREQSIVFTPGEAVELSDEEYAHVLPWVETDEKRRRPLVHVRLDAKKRVRLVDLAKDGEADEAPAGEGDDPLADSPTKGGKSKRKK